MQGRACRTLRQRPGPVAPAVRSRPGIGEAPTMKTARGVTLIANGRLVDGTGAPAVPDAAVVVRDGRIAYAGPARGGAEVPPDADRIDARGGTILPGLVEAHFHPDLFQRRRAGRPGHQVSGRIRHASWPRATPGWRSNAATRRRGAAAACTTSTSGSRRRSRRTSSPALGWPPAAARSAAPAG